MLPVFATNLILRGVYKNTYSNLDFESISRIFGGAPDDVGVVKAAPPPVDADNMIEQAVPIVRNILDNDFTNFQMGELSAFGSCLQLTLRFTFCKTHPLTQDFLVFFLLQPKLPEHKEQPRFI